MDNNPQNSGSQSLRPPAIGSIGSQSFGTAYSMQFRPVVPGQQFIQPTSGAQQYRAVGQPQFSQQMAARPLQPSSSQAMPMPPYMQPNMAFASNSPQFQNPTTANPHMPSLSGIGVPHSSSYTMHTPVASTGGQPWLSSGNQGQVNVMPTGQQPPTITPTNQASNASQDASADWQEYTAGDGRRYYYNKRTKQSSWEKPVELMTPLERADASTVWKEFTTAEGKKYYYNKDTKQSKWTIPEELKLARELAEKEASRMTQSEIMNTAVISTPDQPSASSPVVVTPVIPVTNTPTNPNVGSAESSSIAVGASSANVHSSPM